MCVTTTLLLKESWQKPLCHSFKNGAVRKLLQHTNIHFFFSFTSTTLLILAPLQHTLVSVPVRSCVCLPVYKYRTHILNKPTKPHWSHSKRRWQQTGGEGRWMCPESQAHHPQPTERSSPLPSSAVLSNYSTPELYCHQRNYLVWEYEQWEQTHLLHPKTDLKNERQE